MTTDISPRLLEATAQTMGITQLADPAQLAKVVHVAEMLKDAKPPATAQYAEVEEELNKAFGINLGQSRGLGQALDQMRSVLADMGKEIDFSFANAIPSALGFNVFDLSGPARATYPVLAPLRNTIPRVTGRGPAGLAKVIRGISGSGTGGIGSLNPAFNTLVPLAGGNVEASRGNAISYATGDVIVAYRWHSLYDAVTWPAFFSGEEFQDLRALSATVLMQTAFLAEERAILMGRDTTLAAPAAPTLAARAAVAGETGIVGVGAGGTTVYIKVTAVGPFGETAGSASANVNIAVGVTRVIDVTITDVTGALAYNIYASFGDNAAADPGDASRFFQLTTGYNVGTVGITGRVTTGNTSPGADTGTGSSLNYRGLIASIESGPISGTAITGYSTRANAKLSGTSLTMFQTAFASLWSTAKADPDEIWVNSREAKNAADLIATASNTPYRFAYTEGNQGGIIAGQIVPSVFNESTRKLVQLRIHPWLPVGNAVILSRQLPFPTAFGQTQVMELKGPQDYMQVVWPATSQRYESSIVWFNSLMLYGPTFCGVIHGIAQETAAATGSLQ